MTTIRIGAKVRARYLGGWVENVTVVRPASKPGTWVVDDGHGERAFHPHELELIEPGRGEIDEACAEDEPADVCACGHHYVDHGEYFREMINVSLDDPWDGDHCKLCGCRAYDGPFLGRRYD